MNSERRNWNGRVISEVPSGNMPRVHFWNSTERDYEHAYYPALNYYGIYAGHRIFYKKGRLPVRCILDSGK